MCLLYLSGCNNPIVIHAEFLLCGIVEILLVRVAAGTARFLIEKVRLMRVNFIRVKSVHVQCAEMMILAKERIMFSPLEGNNFKNIICNSKNDIRV